MYIVYNMKTNDQIYMGQTDLKNCPDHLTMEHPLWLSTLKKIGIYRRNIGFMMVFGLNEGHIAPWHIYIYIYIYVMHWVLHPLIVPHLLTHWGWDKMAASLADNIFKRIFLNENIWILIKIPLNFVPKGRINNIPPLVQIIAWRQPGDKPLSEPMMVSILMYIYMHKWASVS